MYSPVVFECALSTTSPNLCSLRNFFRIKLRKGLIKFGIKAAKYNILYSLIIGSPCNGLNSIEQSSYAENISK